jgi:localization factor PodJL
MNSRFADIAAQLERSLKDGRPDRALADMGQRFDRFEASLASVVTAIQSGAAKSENPGEGRAVLQGLETQVAALKSQIDASVNRLEGLDALKGDVAAISRRLEALDRLDKAQTQIISDVANTRGDLGKLARTLEDHNRSTLNLAARAAEPAQDPRVDALHHLLESQVVERREGEAAMVAVLQAIQGAIDELTNRIHQFEDTVASAVLGGAEAASSGQSSQPEAHHAGQHFGQRAVDARAPFHGHAATPEPEPPPAQAQHRLAMQAAPGDAPRKGRGVFRQASEAASPPHAETAVPRTRRGVGNILRAGQPEVAPQSARASQNTEEASAPSRGGEREDMIRVARRSVGETHEAAPLETAGPEIDVETIAARLPGQKRAKPKAARGGFFTFEKAGARPMHVVALVALLAAGAGMLYGTMADRPQAVPARLDKSKGVPALPGKVGALRAPANGPARADDARRLASDIDDGSLAGMQAADQKEAALAVLKPSTDTEAAALHTGSPATPGASDNGSLTTGILIDSGAPMPSVRDLKRYSEEQRMARISSHLGDKAVQKTERDHASPASHTPGPGRQDVLPESGPGVSAVPGPAAQGSYVMGNAAGLPPAQIGPMSLRVAAAKGDPSAEFEVASRFAQGKGVPKDFAKAADWYQRAASRGSAPAQYRLGGLYERGIGVKADPARARAWYKRAAEQGNVKAMHNLAVMFTQRDLGEPDYAAASQWFSKAAGHGLSDSQFNLGILHENGMGVAKAPAAAYTWYALAAERGDPEAGKRRDVIAARMSAVDLDALRLSVAKWRPMPTDPGANDPYMAGQAWRTRNGDDRMGGQGLAPAASVARPASASAPQQEPEIIDLTAAGMEARAKSENAGNWAPAGSGAASSSTNAARLQAAAPPETADQALMNRKRKVTKVQSPGDVEKLLTQFGYNPSALKKARPGGAPDDTVAPPAQAE